MQAKGQSSARCWLRSVAGGIALFSITCCSAAPSVPDAVAATGWIDVVGNEIGDLGYASAYAEDLVIQGCMQLQGFEYPTDPLSAEELSGTYESSNVVSFEEWDPTLHGYDTVFDLDFGPEGTELNTYLEGLGEAELRAWNRAFDGPADGPTITFETADGSVVTRSATGCLAEARMAISTDSTAYSAMAYNINSLVNQVIDLHESDPAWIAALEEWSACMAIEGYVGEFGPFSRPIEAAATFKGAVSDAERAMATVDKACRVSARLPELELETKRRAEQKLWSDNQGLITQWAEMRDEVRASTHRIILEATGVDANLEG